MRSWPSWTWEEANEESKVTCVYPGKRLIIFAPRLTVRLNEGCMLREEAWQAIVFLAVAVLAPLVPAFLLFKFLPSTGKVSGPWKGLNVKFGGAFGGYLVIFFALLASRPADLNHYHTWTVQGRVELRPGSQELPTDPRHVVVRVVPPNLNLLNNGAFDFEIAVNENRYGQLTFPNLQLDLPGYQGTTVALDPNTAYGSPELKPLHDVSNRRITISEPIVLRSLKSVAPYDDSRAEKPQSIDK